MKVFNIEPVPKPRMTQADKWKKRPPVLKYFAFKD
ncbi:TPA: RusA family crossover junction endodeoxyribonuclease, partial [Proteus mirabilis]